MCAGESTLKLAAGPVGRTVKAGGSESLRGMLLHTISNPHLRLCRRRGLAEEQVNANTIDARQF